MTIHHPIYTCAFGCDVGPIVLIKGEPHRIAGANPDGTTTFASTRSGQHVPMDQETFFTKLHNGELVPDASPKEPSRTGMPVQAAVLKRTSEGVPYTAIAAYRAAFVKAILAIPQGNRKTAIEGGLLQQIHRQHFEATGYPEWLQDCAPPSRASVYRWVRYAGRDVNPQALIPEFHRRGARGSRFAPVIETWISELIEKQYTKIKEAALTYTGEELYHEINKRIEAASDSENLRAPSIPTLMRRIYALGGEHRMGHEEGKRLAHMEYSQAEVGPDPIFPLAICEADHTQVDIFVLDDETKRVLGRPWLTLIGDRSSRMIVGYLLSIETPNAADVLAALRHAMLPKHPNHLKRLKVKSEWPVFGQIRALKTDRGRDFVSEGVKRSMEILGIDIAAMPPASPNFKGCVERCFRTLNEKIFHRLPGTTKGNPKARGDRRPEEEARTTFSELNSFIARTICDKYHHAHHSEIKCSPLEKWNELVKRHGPPRAMSAKVIRDATLLRTHAIVTRQGIQIDGIRYNGEALGRVRSMAHAHARGNPEIEILRDPDDVSRIYYLDEPSSEPIMIPAVAPTNLAGVSMRTHALIRKRQPTRYAYQKDPARAALSEGLNSDVRKHNLRRKPKIRSVADGDNASTGNGPTSVQEAVLLHDPIISPRKGTKNSDGKQTALPSLKTRPID